MKKQIVCLAIAFGIVGSGLYMVKGSSSSDTPLYPPPDEDEAVTTQPEEPPVSGIYDVHRKHDEAATPPGTTTYFGEPTDDKPKKPSH